MDVWHIISLYQWPTVHSKCISQLSLSICLNSQVLHFKGHNINLKMLSCARPVPNVKPYFRSYSHTSPLILCKESAVYPLSISLLKHTQGTDLRKLESLSSPSLHTGQESASSNDCDLSPDKTGLRVTTNTIIIPGTIATLNIN